MSADEKIKIEDSLRKMTSVRSAFVGMYAITTMFLVGVAVVVTLLFLQQGALLGRVESRFTSYRLAIELMDSSNDLTRLARTYAVTGDARYEKEYWDILAVRNGEKPRADGRKIALRELMVQAGFTEAEFAKLKAAEDASNALVTTETIAMNAVKGQFDDGVGGYTKKGKPDFDLARRIMHDEKYHADKATIMKPINEFMTILDQRTNAGVSDSLAKNFLILNALAAIVLATIVALAVVGLRVRRVMRQLVQITDHQSQVSEKTRNTNQSLSVTSSSLAAVSSQQAAAVQETVASLTEMMSMIAQTTGHAKESSGLAHRVAEKTQDGQRIMQNMVASMEGIEQAGAQLKNIATIISEIAAKTNVINDIVNKTQLLSFNASIEAARAGAHGRGFAVVAEEVGNLAQMSGTSAKEIQALLQDSQKQVNHILDVTRERVDEGRKVSKDAVGAFNEISRDVDAISTAIQSIAAATREQESGIQQTSAAMRQLDETAQRSNLAAQETAHAAGELGIQGQRLHAVVHISRALILGRSAVEPTKARRERDQVDSLLQDLSEAKDAPVGAGAPVSGNPAGGAAEASEANGADGTVLPLKTASLDDRLVRKVARGAAPRPASEGEVSADDASFRKVV
jgi:methyl-accepting chemotaxis protein